MKTIIEYAGREFETDLAQPVDISIPVSRSGGPNAFYLRQPSFMTVESGGFVGDVGRGGSCNVEDILISPHGNGTHTECAGHISADRATIAHALGRYFFLAQMVSLEAGSRLEKTGIQAAFAENPFQVEALIVRTLPNSPDKKSRNYSGTDPAYFTVGFIEHIKGLGIIHLLTDLPSLDKEDDAGLKAHHAFFSDSLSLNVQRTVTEMIYAPDLYEDGLYWLNLVPAPLESDAAPSKPLIYRTHIKS